MTAQTDEREAKTPGALSAARRKARIFNSGYNAGQAEAAATIAAKDAEIAVLVAESADLTRALTSLTHGGSEFFTTKGERYVADIKACVDNVRQRISYRRDRLIDLMRSGRAKDAEIERLRAEIARKDEALAPFADDAAQWDESPDCDDDHPIGWDSQLTIGDLRRARAARSPT